MNISNNNIIYNIPNNHNNMNPNIIPNNNSDIKEFIDYVNTQNNMNLKKIILFYSKFSKICEQFINAVHPNYKHIISYICVDNSKLRKRLSESKFKLKVVPTVFMLFENGKVNVHIGQELNQLVIFLNKNMENYMIFKTNSILKKSIQNNITNLNINQIDQNLAENNLNTQLSKLNTKQLNPNERNLNGVTRLGIKDNNSLIHNNSKKILNERMKHLPRVKQPISQDFNKEPDVGISSKRLVPKGKKEHQKMAISSISMIESSKQLDTIDEDDDDDDDDDDEDDNLQMEDGVLLGENINEILNEDNTIDPIIKKDGKSLKDIAADMQQDRELIDNSLKPVN